MAEHNGGLTRLLLRYWLRQTAAGCLLRVSILVFFSTGRVSPSNASLPFRFAAALVCRLVITFLPGRRTWTAVCCSRLFTAFGISAYPQHFAFLFRACDNTVYTLPRGTVCAFAVRVAALFRTSSFLTRTHVA